MNTLPFLSRETSRSLARIWPRLEFNLVAEIESDPDGWKTFTQRLNAHFPPLFELYFGLYGTHYDFFFHLEDLIISLARAWFARPADLRKLDSSRETNPLWFQSNKMLGGVLYVDLFAGNLEGVRSKIPILQRTWFNVSSSDAVV